MKKQIPFYDTPSTDCFEVTLSHHFYPTQFIDQAAQAYCLLVHTEVIAQDEKETVLRVRSKTSEHPPQTVFLEFLNYILELAVPDLLEILEE